MKWEDLNTQNRAELIKLYVRNGVTSLDKMKEHYNSFGEGGHLFGKGGGKTPQSKRPALYGLPYFNQSLPYAPIADEEQRQEYIKQAERDKKFDKLLKEQEEKVLALNSITLPEITIKAKRRGALNDFQKMEAKRMEKILGPVQAARYVDDTEYRNKTGKSKYMDEVYTAFGKPATAAVASIGAIPVVANLVAGTPFIADKVSAAVMPYLTPKTIGTFGASMIAGEAVNKEAQRRGYEGWGDAAARWYNSNFQHYNGEPTEVEKFVGEFTNPGYLIGGATEKAVELGGKAFKNGAGDVLDIFGSVPINYLKYLKGMRDFRINESNKIINEIEDFVEAFNKQAINNSNRPAIMNSYFRPSKLKIGEIVTPKKYKDMGYDLMGTNGINDKGYYYIPSYRPGDFIRYRTKERGILAKKGLIGHELQHSWQPKSNILDENSPFPLTQNDLSESYYFFANPEHPLYKSSLHYLDKNKQKAGWKELFFPKSWKGSPDEVDSEMMRFRVMLDKDNDIYKNIQYYKWPKELKEKVIKQISKRFSLKPRETTKLLYDMSTFGYF